MLCVLISSVCISSNVLNLVSQFNKDNTGNVYVNPVSAYLQKGQISGIYKPNAMMSLIPIETEGLESEYKKQ